jgi:hypothetical protein
MSRTTRLLSLSAGLAAAALAAAPRPAKACGGTFCDGGVPGPQQMPVDQTGENILFVFEGDHVEAHIQIQYEGDPERFGWVIPVQAIPDVEAGSQPLFDNLLAATVPTFTLDQQQESCSGQAGASVGCFMAGARADAGGFNEGGTGATAGDEGGEDGGNPDVVKRGFAGAFQYDVLQGGTVQGVVDWLDTAGYVQDPDAPPILQEYLDEGFLFVAIKLRAGAGVDEIHPVVIRYEGMEPCVPIRLTRIAAVQDMAIRAFFLGEHRMAPRNYQHVELNPLKFDWIGIIGGTGPRYNEAVALAMDEAEAGQAFVTEYAGTSAVVSQANLRELAWDSAPFVDAEPTEVVDILSAQGLMSCDAETGECTYAHGLVEGLLAEFLPVPDGLDPYEFYSCLECHAAQIDLDVWDGPGFAAMMEERIIVPGEHAIDLLDGYPYLTRLFTAISPEEMTEDPFFWENPDLPDVSNQFFATRWLACEGPDWLELEDGRVIALTPDQSMPNLPGTPYAEKVQEIMTEGSPVDVDDQRDTIDEALEAWNDEQRTIDAGGCGCRAARLPAEGLLFAGIVFGIALPRRRRR